MNEFTKDELEEIVDMMHYARKQGVETTHNLSYQVELKAKSMIDNYCEHSESIMDCDGGITLVCKECGAITMDI